MADDYRRAWLRTQGGCHCRYCRDRTRKGAPIYSRKARRIFKRETEQLIEEGMMDLDFKVTMVRCAEKEYFFVEYDNRKHPATPTEVKLWGKLKEIQEENRMLRHKLRETGQV